VFEELAFPFGLVLYYLFNFIVMIGKSVGSRHDCRVFC